MTIQEQLKKLKEVRGPVSQALQDYRKYMNTVNKQIISTITETSKTVPEISKELNMSTTDVFWHINALKKYNKVVDDGKKGSYMLYKAIDKGDE